MILRNTLMAAVATLSTGALAPTTASAQTKAGHQPLVFFLGGVPHAGQKARAVATRKKPRAIVVVGSSKRRGR